jgi:hypothetical protein
MVKLKRIINYKNTIKRMNVILKTIIYKKLGLNDVIKNKYKFYKMINDKKSKFYKIKNSKHH